MSAMLPEPRKAAPAELPPSVPSPAWLARLTWIFVGLLFLVNAPAFLRMGLDFDAISWDLCARNVLQGGIHYRDAVENNLPGMLWLHLAIRSTLGWSSGALRLFDLTVVISIAVLLLRYVPGGTSHLARPLTALALLACYFSTSEWCHCQRDLWMLLPALVALHLRARQLRRIEHAKQLRVFVAWSMCEGLVWAGAFWMKPHIGLVALAVWLAGAALVVRTRGPRFAGILLADLAGLMLGGVLVGAAGTAWIVETGAFPAFREIIFDWNREYLDFDITIGSSRADFLRTLVHHVPWLLVNVSAVPMAFCDLAAKLRRQDWRDVDGSLLDALYLGWVLQTLLLQHPFDYIFVPSALLSIVIVARGLANLPRSVSVVALAMGFFVVSLAQWPKLLQHPNDYLYFLLVLLGVLILARRLNSSKPVVVAAVAMGFCLACIVQWPKTVARRIELLPACILQANSAQLRDDLTLCDFTNWQDLERVAAFLREQQVKDGEVTCYPCRTALTYLLLDIRPSTRYYALENCLVILKRQRPLIKRELALSRQRFIVCDLRRLGLSDRDIAAMERRGHLPWSERICFRAGRYVVLAVPAREMPGWLESSFRL